MSTNCAGLIENLVQAVRELCNPRRDMAVASAQLHRALDSQEDLDGTTEEVQPLQSSLPEDSHGAQASQDYFGEDPGEIVELYASMHSGGTLTCPLSLIALNFWQC